jgi:peptidyl-prolyl cis-trans isomerase-like 6
MAPQSFDIAIYGLLNSSEYQLAKHCLDDLKRTHLKQISHSEIHPLLEYEWNSFLRNKRAELRGETWSFNDKCMVFIDKQLLGNAEQFLNWAKNTFDHIDFRANELLGVFSNEEYTYILISN